MLIGRITNRKVGTVTIGAEISDATHPRWLLRWLLRWLRF
jgi:hypothetical protein